MFGKASRLFALAVVLLVTGAVHSYAKNIIETQRVPFDSDGFSIRLPVGWEAKRQDMPLFSLFICLDPAKQKNTDITATISIMFGRREKEHDKDFFENVLKGIKSSEIINRGLFTAYKKQEKVSGEWIHYTQKLKDGSKSHVTVYLLTDAITAYIVICFAPESSYEKYTDLFREVGNSIIIE